jgi:single-strand DNA-binding protein
MNMITLIGKMSSTPKYVELKNGERWANFTLSTSENYIDKHGNTQHKLYWHRACAWGQSLKLLEEFGKPGMGMCIEGKLVSKFFKNKQGETQLVSEIEINDLVVMD